MKRKGPHQHFCVMCECTTKVNDCGHTSVTTHVLAPCIHKGTATELFERMVKDSVSYKELEPHWVAFACKRIADAWNMKPDDVFNRFRDEVASQSGSSLLPGTFPT